MAALLVGRTNFFCNQTWQGQLVMLSLKLLLKKNFTVTFYGWGSTVSKLHSHYEETVHFLPLGHQGFLVLIWPTSEGWKAELTLKPPSGFELGTPGLEIQHLNHQVIARLDLPIFFLYKEQILLNFSNVHLQQQIHFLHNEMPLLFSNSWAKQNPSISKQQLCLFDTFSTKNI